MSAALTEIDTAVGCLRAGGVVLLPTDTVLGLACLPEHAAKIYALKQRPPEKNLPVMVADKKQIEALGAQLDARSRALIASDFMPGPLTLILALSGERPAYLQGRPEVAVRMPDDKVLLNILHETGPLFVTSANRTGEATAAQTDHVQLAGDVDYIVQGAARMPAPSTIVNLCGDTVKIERLGAISQAQIDVLLEDL